MARKSRKGKQNNPAPVYIQPAYIAGLYARISVNNDGRNTSVANQIEYMRNFLKQKEDITVYDIYVDDGVSSFNKNRLAFKKMMDDVKTNKINCIIVNDISRFSRDYIEATEYLEKVFPTLQIRFISVFDEYDSLHSNDKTFLMMIKTVLAYAYSKELSKKIEMQFEHKQHAGTYTPSRLPYGYTKIQNDDNVEWIIEEKTGIIVKQIFEMAQHGVSGYSIAKELNLQGIPSPQGAYWSAVSVRRILTNRTYLGEFVTHKTKSNLLKNQKAIPLPESQWLYHKDHHAPIIDEDLFDLIQNNLATNEKFPSKNSIMVDFFQGKLYCGTCNRKLKQKKANDGTIYYICPMRDEVGAACNSKSQRSDKLKIMVFNALKEKIKDVHKEREAIIRFENSLYYKRKEERDNNTLIELKQQSDFQMELFIKLLEERYDSGNSDKPMTDDQCGLQQHMKNMREYIKTQTDAIEKEKFEYKTARSIKTTRINAYLEYEQETELTSEMLDALVDRVLVLPNSIQVLYI